MRNSRDLQWPRRRRLHLLSGLLPIVLAASLPAIAAAESDISISIDADDSTGNVVKIDGAGETSQDVVRMGEPIEIGADQIVEGDVVAIGGPITILGKVYGDVVAIGGPVTLKAGSTVNGDVVTIGGNLDREEGAVVLGQNVSMGFVPKEFGRLMARAGGKDHDGFVGVKIWWDFLRAIGFFLIALVLYLAFPKRIMVIRETSRSRFWLALVIGLAGIVGVLTGLVLLCITCIGILAAVPGFFLFLVALAAGGAVTVSLLGEVLLRRPVTDAKSWSWTLLSGLAVLFLLQLVGRLLDGAGDGGSIVGGSIRAIGKTAWFVLITVGFGGLIISKFGKVLPGDRAAAHPIAPATPTPPVSPPPSA